MPEITRIDFYLLPDNNIQIFKYPSNWSSGAQPVANYVTDKPLSEMIAWLKDHGWTVRTWESGLWLGGARAFLGELKPIRTSTEIMRRRDLLRQSCNGAKPYNYTTNGLDFAYDT